MQAYHDLLRITEEIECSLKNEAFNLLAPLQIQRLEAYRQLPAKTVPSQSEKTVELISVILRAEKRCLTLTKKKKKLLAREMGTTGRAKKLHKAYGRQDLP